MANYQFVASVDDSSPLEGCHLLLFESDGRQFGLSCQMDDGAPGLVLLNEAPDVPAPFVTTVLRDPTVSLGPAFTVDFDIHNINFSGKAPELGDLVCSRNGQLLLTAHHVNGPCVVNLESGVVSEGRIRGPTIESWSIVVSTTEDERTVAYQRCPR